MVVLVILFFGFGLIDTYLTQKAIQLGARELNPFLKNIVQYPALHWVTVIMINALVAWGLIGCWGFIASIILCVLILIQTCVIWHNWRKIYGKY